jgi:hypothetical protein
VQTESHELLPACPSCGGLSIHLAGGNELVLESIRLGTAALDTGCLEIGESVPPEPDDGHVHPHPLTRRGAVPTSGG